MVRLTFALLAANFLFPLPAIAAQNGKAPTAQTPTTVTDQAAVIQAIEDEIYDWGCQRHVEFIGKEIAPGAYQLRVYIRPTLEDGRGEIIYKFMPFGEIHRSFEIGESGLAYLEDTPTQGFGPERPASKTVFMDDDEVLKDKRDWSRRVFVIQYRPNKERLRQARERQHKRLGEIDYGPYKDCPV